MDNKYPDLYKKAFWCTCCRFAINGKCTQGVPYYASSINCKYFEEPPLLKHIPKKRFDLKKILVETF